MTSCAVDKEAERLTLILQYTRLAAVPQRKQPRPGKANPWWSAEVAKALKTAQAAQNRRCELAKRVREGRLDLAETAAAAKGKAGALQNRKKAIIRRAKREAGEEVREATSESIWKMPPHPRFRSRAAKTMMEKPARDGGEAVKMRPMAAEKEMLTRKTDDGAHEWPELREDEVNAALFSSRSFAAAGPDNIPNAFLQMLDPHLRLRLIPLAAAALRLGLKLDFKLGFSLSLSLSLLRLGHLPRPWRDTIGLVLRKPKKPDYSRPKAYRMISFKREVVKAFETARSTAYGWIDDVNAFAWGRTAEEAVRALNSRLPLIETWSRTHSSRFEPLKSAAVLFTPPGKRTPDTLPPVRLCGEDVPFSPSLIMLGTELDAHLSFAPHVAACAARAHTALNSVKALLSTKTWVTMALGRQLVQGVVAPRLHSPLPPPPQNLRFAPSPALPPTRLALAAPKPRSHPSALHHALASPLLPPVTDLEHIHPDPVAPWERIPQLETTVAVSKAEAEAEVQRMLARLEVEDMAAFSDGSELEKGWTGTGLAVRLEENLWADRKETLGQYRGVYKAELFGIYLAITSIPQLFPSPSTTDTLHILADNVSALTAPADPRPTPGQSTPLATLAALRHARKARPHVSIQLTWVPGHQHPAPPSAPQNEAMDTGKEGETGAAGAGSGRTGYGPDEGFNVDEFSAPGQLGSAAGAAAAREAPVLNLTASNEETDKEEVGWAVWHEALKEVVGAPLGCLHGPAAMGAWPRAEAGKEVMDLIGVTSDKDSNNKRERQAAGAWAAAERRVLQSDKGVTSPSPTATTPPSAPLGAPIRLRSNTTHPNSATRARAIAKLRALYLISSMIKLHPPKEAEAKRKHQVKRMQNVTYSDSPPSQALSNSVTFNP
ncbi:hypothetical protein JCM8097_006110 [Rhodosporidiobolus ruineniae]